MTPKEIYKMLKESKYAQNYEAFWRQTNHNYTDGIPRIPPANIAPQGMLYVTNDETRIKGGDFAHAGNKYIYRLKLKDGVIPKLFDISDKAHREELIQFIGQADFDEAVEEAIVPVELEISSRDNMHFTELITDYVDIPQAIREMGYDGVDNAGDMGFFKPQDLLEFTGRTVKMPTGSQLEIFNQESGQWELEDTNPRLQ